MILGRKFALEILSFTVVIAMAWAASNAYSADTLDLAAIKPDLQTPKMISGNPGPGKRVKQTHPSYKKSELFHALYLPTDWEAGKKFPVIFEYPGNGPFRNKLGDTNSGYLEDCNLGYGASGGKGFIWVCLPFVNSAEKKQQLQWWGDAEATVAYCKAAVNYICDEYDGDRSKLVLAGFSRGAIACNYIGLRDDGIAALWRGFIVHSHYDGVRQWPYPDSDRDSAIARLERLKGRPQYISHEASVDATREFLEKSGSKGDFTFVSLPFPNHTDTWVLRPLPERQKLRDWLKRVVHR